MPNFTCLVFGEAGKFGWSEAYPIAANNGSSAANELDSLIALRAQCLPQNAKLVGGRVSDTDVKNDSWPLQTVFPMPGNFGVSGVDDYYNPQFSLRVKQFAGAQHRASRWIRAIPKSQVADDGSYNPSGAFPTALLNFLQALGLPTAGGLNAYVPLMVVGLLAVDR